MVEASKDNAQNSPKLQVVLSILELIKAALWPGFAILLFLSFYSPLYEIATGLPGLLSRADVITIGQLNIKLNAALANQATQGVREGLKGLDGSSAHRLLELVDADDYCVDPDRGADDEMAQNLSADERLQNLQLVKLTPSSSLQPSSAAEKCYEASPTEQGKNTQNILLTILTDALTNKSN